MTTLRSVKRVHSVADGAATFAPPATAFRIAVRHCARFSTILAVDVICPTAMRAILDDLVHYCWIGED